MKLLRVLGVLALCLFTKGSVSQSLDACQPLLDEVLLAFNRAHETKNLAILKQKPYQKKLAKLREVHRAYQQQYCSPSDSLSRANNEAVLMVLAGNTFHATRVFEKLAGSQPTDLTTYHLALSQLLSKNFIQAEKNLDATFAPNSPLNQLVAFANTRSSDFSSEAIPQRSLEGTRIDKYSYNRGLLLRKSGHPHAAIESLTEALNRRDTPAYRISRGEAYLEVGNLEHALQDFIQAGNKVPDALIRRGYTLARMKRFDDARRVLHSYLRTKDRTYRWQAHLILADTYYQEHRYTDAKAFYAQAARYRQAVALSQYGLANIALTEQQYPLAKAIFGGILASDTTFLPAYLGRAIAHYGLRDFDEALNDFFRAEVLIDTPAPETSHVLVCRGFSHYYTGNRDEARKDFNRAITLDSTRYEALAGLGLLEIDRRRFAEAGKFVAAALVYEKTYDRLWTNYGNLLMHFNMHDKAFSVFKHAVGLNPRNVNAQNGFGVTLLEKDQLEQSKSLFDSLVRTNPQDPVLLNNRGIVHAYLGNRLNQRNALTQADETYRLAEKDFNLAMQTAPSKTFYHVNKGNVHRYWQQYEDARLSYQTYQDKSALNNTAVLLAGLERLKDAKYYMNIALQLDSTQRVFHYNLNLLNKGKAKEMARFVASSRDNGPYSEISIKYSLDGYVTLYLYDYEYQALHFPTKYHSAPTTLPFPDGQLLAEFDFRFLPYSESRNEKVAKARKPRSLPIRIKNKARKGTKCPVRY